MQLRSAGPHVNRRPSWLPSSRAYFETQATLETADRMAVAPCDCGRNAQDAQSDAAMQHARIAPRIGDDSARRWRGVRLPNQSARQSAAWNRWRRELLVEENSRPGQLFDRRLNDRQQRRDVLALCQLLVRDLGGCRAANLVEPVNERALLAGPLLVPVQPWSVQHALPVAVRLLYRGAAHNGASRNAR